MEFQKIPMNEYQTELTEELVNSLPQEVQDQLFDIDKSYKRTCQG